jgi:hypothetical protein
MSRPVPWPLATPLRERRPWRYSTDWERDQPPKNSAEYCIQRARLFRAGLGLQRVAIPLA